MATIVLRIPKGSPLTLLEIDNNFNNINEQLVATSATVNAATSSNTASTIVKRDASGEVSLSKINSPIVNNITITAPALPATLNIAQNSTLNFGGEFVTSITSTAATSVTLPVSGTLATLAGAETLTNKTLNSPTLSNVSYSGTIANGGTVSTIDINGGTIDNTAIGVTTPSSVAATTISASGDVTLSGTNNAVGTVTSGVWSGTAIVDGKIASALTGKTYNGLSLSALGVGFSLSGGTVSKTLTVGNSISLLGTDAQAYTFPSTSATIARTDAAQTFTGNQTFSNDVIIDGNITVNGTSSIINSTTVTVDDKNIELGSVTTPTDATANGGGITLKGATDKTIIWDSGNLNWTLSEHINIPTGKAYKINNINILTDTALNASVVSSSLTSVGTLASGTWNGSVILGQYGGTGVNNTGKTITLGGSLTTSGAFTTTLTLSGNTNVTLPTSGTLSTITGTETLTNKTLAAPVLNGGSVPTGYKLSVIDAPTVNTDVANKLYVDNLATGLQIKEAALVATTGNIVSLSAGAPLSVDSVVLANGNRVLVKDQTTQTENGVYIVTSAGTGSNGVWTRATDLDASTEFTSATVYIQSGFTNAGSTYVQQTPSPTLGVSSIIWNLFSSSSIVAGNGLVKSGVDVSVVGTTNRILVNADSIDIGSDVATLSGTQSISGTKTFTVPVKFGNYLSKYSGTISTSATTTVTLDSYAVATQKSGKYVIQASAGTSAHLTEVFVIADGNVTPEVFISEYGTILTTASKLFDVTAVYSAGNVIVQVTPTSPSATVFRFSVELLTI